MRARSFLLPLALLSTTLAAQSPWNGTWVLNVQRSVPGAKEGAAAAYRFTLGPDHTIRWEIPSLGEVVTGHTDGQPMLIHRPGLSPGMTLAVTTDGPLTLLYKVAKDGKPFGEGRMTLVEDGKAWVDLTWPAGHPEQAGALVYNRK